jgi:hypothetical protein
MFNLPFTSFLMGLWWGLKRATSSPQPPSTGVPPPPKPLLVLPPPKPKE